MGTRQQPAPPLELRVVKIEINVAGLPLRVDAVTPEALGRWLWDVAAELRLGQHMNMQELGGFHRGENPVGSYPISVRAIWDFARPEGS